jgi:hypothetical protein
MKRIVINIASVRSHKKPHRQICAAGALFGLALALSATASVAAGKALEITAKKENETTIRVVAPGAFEFTFTKQKGFVGDFYDLKHDPQKKRNLAPVNPENGLLWTKNAPVANPAGGSWYANPPDTMELIEAGPARVRVRVAGPHRRYGNGNPEAAWKELAYEQTFTIYPTGNVYIDYALVAGQPQALKGFLLIIKSTGAWGKEGKGEGKGEAHCACESGADRPTGPQASSFGLQWSDGPTYFQDFLLVFQKGKFGGSYWNMGYLHEDYRTGFDILSRFPNNTVPQGKDHIFLLMRFADDLNSPAAAKPHAEDYRAPDRLEVSEGALDAADEGDLDRDGFNETEGCYVLKAGARQTAFVLHGAKTPRMLPVLKLKGWTAAAPKSISLGEKELLSGKDFLASSQNGILLVQLLDTVREDAKITISPR